MNSRNDTAKIHKIGFLTSGGDAPGMNAAIRSIVRMSIYMNCIPYAIIGGFQGLVDGGDSIVEYGWDQVAFILAEGGTIIRSSRCAEFRDRQGRLRAAHNLVKLGIDKLIVIGGDGSLTGADKFRQEWAGLLEELYSLGKISFEESKACESLMIVGLVGSIDNDMFGTEMTIGANSSLHRIIEAVDNISFTASSHSRAFIIEVMGRHCGWLAVNACLAIGADYLFIPEDPPKEGWEDQMKSAVKRRWEIRGRMSTIVIVCEGAVDAVGKPIRPEYIKNILENCGLDSRITTLGHIQRGGAPSAFDRYMSTLQGVEAVKALLDSNPSKTPSLMIGIRENKIIRLPLMECVEKTQLLSEKLRNCQFQEAFNLRGPDFKANFEIVKAFYQMEEAQAAGLSSPVTPIRIAFLNCGAPCGGINAANRAIILYCIFKGYTPIGVFGGFSGLIKGELREISLNDGPFMAEKGGSFLGMNRTLPSENLDMVAFQLEKYKVDGLIIIGGFEGFSAQLELASSAGTFPIFKMPIVCLPATISNNVPGTDFSVGSDTALNIIVQCADSLKQSASSSRKRAFIVDVQGGNCGYLASIGGLACGATSTYIPEEGIDLKTLCHDIEILKQRFKENTHQGRLILRNESSSSIFTSEIIAKIFESESEGLFDARWATLGHLQQGGSPSPLDRIRATRLAVMCVSFVEHKVTGKPIAFQPFFVDIKEESGHVSEPTEPFSVMIGIRGPSVMFSASSRLQEEANHKLRRPVNQWWLEHRPLAKILAKNICSKEFV